MLVAAPFVALLSFITTLLALNVSRERIAKRIPHGEGANHELSRVIRAHGNSVEHLVPIGLCLLAAGALDCDATAIRVLGWSATIARVLVTAGILVKGRFALRRWGAWSTYAIELALVALVVEEAFAGRCHPGPG